MKKIILIQVLCLATLLTMGQVRDCDKLKKGKFTHDSDVAGLTIITRKGDIQREENEKYGIIMEYKITWSDSCTYRVTPYKIIKNDSKIEMMTDLKLETVILELKADSYIQRTTSLVNGISRTSEIKILKGRK